MMKSLRETNRGQMSCNGCLPLGNILESDRQDGLVGHYGIGRAAHQRAPLTTHPPITKIAEEETILGFATGAIRGRGPGRPGRDAVRDRFHRRADHRLRSGPPRPNARDVPCLTGAASMATMADAPMPSPILTDKDYAEPSAFTPENLLREARRQKGLPIGSVPKICVLDPDGDILRDRIARGEARRDPSWACYHTDLFIVDGDAAAYGLIGGVVGASFAVLVAEELFASGCEYLLSITSAGQLAPLGSPPYFVLIERALRDEGTSHHYLPPARYAEGNLILVDAAERALGDAPITVVRGGVWTTDAPFRETAAAIAARRAEGLLAVEMEAAALYAFAAARDRRVLCVAHVTNEMGRVDRDFEKGEAMGAHDALRLIDAILTSVQL